MGLHPDSFVWIQDFPPSSVGKESACNAGKMDSTPGSGKSPGEGNGNPLQYSCLENPMDRGDLRATQSMGRKSRTRLIFHYYYLLLPLAYPKSLPRAFEFWLSILSKIFYVFGGCISPVREQVIFFFLSSSWILKRLS